MLVVVPLTIEQLGFSTDVELEIQDGHIVLRALRHARAGWEEVLHVQAWRRSPSRRCSIAVRQQVRPDHLQARVNTTARMIAWGGQPSGAAAGRTFAELFDVRTALVIVAAGVGVSAVYGWFSPLRAPLAPPASADDTRQQVQREQ